MKRTALLEVLVFSLLLAVGAGVRVWLQQLPNFAPVAAIALFAGYFFRSWLVAAALPLAIMGLSDQIIGGYDTRMMIVVHATLALPVLCRGFLRRQVPTGSGRSLVRFSCGVLASSLAASSVFFLVTNFGSWLWFDLYEMNAAGLLRCYVNALPFFRPTLLGDMAFATLLFGSYATAVNCGYIADRSAAATATT